MKRTNYVYLYQHWCRPFKLNKLKKKLLKSQKIIDHTQHTSLLIITLITQYLTRYNCSGMHAHPSVIMDLYKKLKL